MVASTSPAEPVRPAAPAWSPGLVVLATGLAVFGAAWAGITLTRETNRIAAIWAANAVVLAALLRRPTRDWPGLVAASLAGNVSANLAVGDAAIEALGLALINTLEVLICAVPLRRAESVPDLTRSRTLALFCALAAGPAPIVSGLLAAGLLTAIQGASFWGVLATWVPADALGLVALTPLLLSLRTAELRDLFRREHLAHTLGVLGLTVAILAAVFGQSRYPLLFLPFPVLVFVAFRLGFAGAALALGLTAAVALAATLSGYGPLTLVQGTLREQVLVLQVFVTVAALTALQVAAVLAERVRLEGALRESETRYRLLADHATDLVVHSSLDTTRRYVSPAARDLLGYEPHELVGTRPLDFVHPEEVDAYARVLDRLASGRSDEALSQQRYRRRDGTYVWVEVKFRLIRDEEGRPGSYVASIRDISERKAAELATRESEARYRLLADNMSDLIVLGHMDGRRSYISPAVTPMLGYTVEEAHRVPMSDWVHPDDLGAVFATTRALARPGASASVVYRLRRKDGGYIWAEAAFRRVDATIVTAIRDVSERQARSEELRLAKEAADAASQAKTEFLAAMSHEIRTPLNAVLGYTDLIAESGRLPPDLRRHAELVREAGAALLTLVDDILDFSKIEAGAVELVSQPFALAALVDNCVSIVRGAASAKGLEISSTLDPGLTGQFRGDEARLRQVLLNLLNNAVKFTPQGSVTLEVRHDESEPHEGLNSAGERLRFLITDTGIGIPEDKQHRLFQRFSQADGTISREFGGTGLGLAICRRLVELMGGDIGVVSRAGAGATFWFTLTLPRVNAQPRLTAVEAGLTGPGRRGRLLVVEDVEVNRDLARLVLEAAGHSVAVAGDGVEAVRAVREGAYDLVLMDVQMPGMDGLAATRAIRAGENSERHLPIIGMTANVLPAQVRALREAGMDDHVAKPFNRAALYAAVDRWLAIADSEQRTALP